MDLQLVRHATLRLNYHGHQILIDPYFAPRHNRAPLVGKSKNPMTDLPMTIDDIINGTELVIVSHLHFDHFDPVAQEALPKNLKIICQPGDEAKIEDFGFTDVIPLTNEMTWNGIKLSRTVGQHGTGDWLERMGSVMGFVLQAPSEPRLYWSGDTIWIDDIAETLERYQPNVIVTHSSGSEFEDNQPIVMNAEHTIRVCQQMPESKVIATHMETIDHGTVSREGLRDAADAANIPLTQLLIPRDGETITLHT
ncbi:MAG: MBL fold metallo-hydrolase [Phototrophicaceae bacterium]